MQRLFCVRVGLGLLVLIWSRSAGTIALRGIQDKSNAENGHYGQIVNITVVLRRAFALRNYLQ